jgi:hypothetical protein
VTEPTTIAVYVRKEEVAERLLSFNPPKDIPQAELLAPVTAWSLDKL